MRFSKKIIIFSLVFLLLFTISVLVLFAITGCEPSTLITAVFAFWGLEGGILGWIKTNERKYERNEESQDMNNENDHMSRGE